ncbi:MAG: SMP-30/gluconolactonase/LRE family protein [Myxococcota bacterium]
MSTTEVLVDGLHFPEGPRWRDGWLWFSDMHAPAVKRVSPEGVLEELFPVPGRPSGLGWLPDGRLLVVSMTDRRVLRREADGQLVEHADLSKIATYDCNDMLVDDQGRAYVGNFGSEPDFPRPPSPATLALVGTDGSVRKAAADLIFPNGCVLTPDGRTLIVGETFGARLSAFDVAPDGSLSNRRVWAERAGMLPDGCCLDSEGGIWVASPMSGGDVLRVVEGGEVTHRIRARSEPFACMLGGEDRRTLFVCTAANAEVDYCRDHTSGAIEVAQVEWPAAGLP